MKTGTLRDFTLPSKATISLRCLDIVLQKPDHVIRLKSFIPGGRPAVHLTRMWNRNGKACITFFWFSMVCFAVSFYLMFLGLGSHLVEKLSVQRMQKVEGHRPSSMQNQL